MKRTYIKKIFLLITIVITVIFIFNITFAATQINPSDYKPDSLDNPNNADSLKNIGNSIIGFLQIIGSILSVSILVIMGIKYMMGSAEERAEYKKTMLPYVIGAFMIFGITNLLGIISSVAQTLL